MLDRVRLARAVVRLRSERPSHWRDELHHLQGGPTRGPLARLKYTTISEVSALCVVLKEPADLREDEAEFRERFWRRLALRRRLRLTNDSCYGRSKNVACYCGEEALDALTDDELEPLNMMEARARVQQLAKARHKRPPRPREAEASDQARRGAWDAPGG